MSKRRRPWGLMGLLGLGGLVMLSGQGSDASSGDGDGGDGAGGDDSGGSGGSGGADGGGDSGSGGSGGSSGGGSDDDGGFDLPPPPKPTDDSEDEPADDPTEDDPPKWEAKFTKGRGKGKGKDSKPDTSDPTPEDEDDEPTDDPDDGPPWAELLDPYPRGSRFYPVKQDDRFGGTSAKYSIAYRYLVSEAYLAAVEVGGLEHNDALAWAVAVGKQDKVRVKVIDLIQCSGWNDAMYGADPVKVSHASQHGRSILLRPVHGPTAARLANNETPFRNITMAGNPANGTYREYELLWQPAIDRVVLWDSGGSAITTTNMLWADGTSMENPPPWVMALGIADETGALAGDFGCPGADGELEVAP